MTYIGQLPSMKPLWTLFLSSGYGPLSCVLIGENAIFMIFDLSESFKKLNFCCTILLCLLIQVKIAS